MHIIDIVSRISGLLLSPGKEWLVISTENKDRKTIFIRFVVPLLCLITITSILGSLLFASRTVFSFSYVVFGITKLWCSLCSGLYLSTFIITEIMARQLGSKDYDKIFTLMAYSSGTAYLVIAVVELFPFFSELSVLTFYSCYLFWRGIPYMTLAQGQNRMVFSIVSFVVAALVFSLMFFFFGNVLRAILNP